MLADIGTKALEPSVFIFLRDQLCGYARIPAKKITARWNNKADGTTKNEIEGFESLSTIRYLLAV
jgi:hypothetical protein